MAAVDVRLKKKEQSPVRRRILQTLASAAWLTLSCGSPRLCAADAAAWRQQIEADWLLQDEVRSLTDPQNPVTTQEDALGAVDGIKNGKWNTHTSLDDQPWWHVDLGREARLDRVEIYNRCDGCAARTTPLNVLLSNDGKDWREVYRHEGPTFYGFTDKKPLVVPLKGARARWLRVQLRTKQFLHLDEVEIYGTEDPTKNLALHRPADQSSVSPWSVRHRIEKPKRPSYRIAQAIERGLQLAHALREAGAPVGPFVQELTALAKKAKALSKTSPEAARRALYMQARWAVRKLALTNPLLDFDGILFAKRKPSSYSHMSDQYYGWWSRPGGGLFVLEDFKTGSAKLRCIVDRQGEGSFLRPDLSYDGRRVLFAYCKYYPHVAGVRNKLEKTKLPEDAFYHIFEIGIDGSGPRQLTRGRYDDFDARYLPSGEIVFLSTRRGQFIQCGKASAAASTREALPDSYVRCGGGPSRPVAIYTLHVMDADAGGLRAISPFENFEWTPSISNDGRILYARWDYVDRHNMPYMSLWSTNPDGANPQAVYGNYTRSPHCVFEARSVPHSTKIIFTASAHHAITAGSLVLLDPNRGCDGPEPIERLTPEVCFPEIEGWPHSYFANPYPLSEDFYLVAWSPMPIRRQGRLNVENALGIYLFDRFGNLELLHRDPAISSMYPIPVRARRRPSVIASTVDWTESADAKFLVQNVYEGTDGLAAGSVKRLRIVAVPAKTQPQMNRPSIGQTRDDPGKCVLGTVPVHRDGSAYFHAPAGVSFFFQALDAAGLAVQTMRTVTYAQPGQTLSCVGCHEPRHTAPANVRPLAALRPAAKIVPGPPGSWPLRFDRLVQPILDRHCVRCHGPKGDAKAASKMHLTGPRAYDALVSWGKPSLRDHVIARYRRGQSIPGACAAQTSPLLAMLRQGHHGVRLSADDLTRLVTWMDTYAQRSGSFSADQEERLRRLRVKVAALLTD